jgi:DNA (cytosine-5)-methyltransferase 1
MKNKFISRSFTYKIKMLAGGIGRIYIKNSSALRAAKFFAGTKISIASEANRVVIKADASGSKSIMNTARGELLELRDKATGEAFGGNDGMLVVTIRENCIVITLHHEDEKEQKRAKRFIDSLRSGKPLRKGSLFSGTGMLAFSLQEGLKKQGINSAIAFANDNSELAMTCNLEGNPIWESATDDALAIVDDLHRVNPDDLPRDLDWVEIGYPCVGFSALTEAAKYDLLHPHCGTLFIPLVNALKRMNPAVITFENVPNFGTSETLSLIERALPDYRFSQKVFNGHDFGELESRPRVCIMAVTKSLPEFDFEAAPIPDTSASEPISSFLNDVAHDSPLWRTMNHVKKRDTMSHIGYRNCLYTGAERSMTTIPASYGSPKAGTPMIQHPTNPVLQRQIMPDEHGRIRRLPASLQAVIEKVWKGDMPLVSQRGNASATHRLLGNGVSRTMWQYIGNLIGIYCNKLINPMKGRQLEFSL